MRHPYLEEIMMKSDIRQDGDERGMIACTPQGCLWV
jgi:hypothetical protein